jgi:hypothetical protein
MTGAPTFFDFLLTTKNSLLVNLFTFHEEVNTSRGPVQKQRILFSRISGLRIQTSREFAERGGDRLAIVGRRMSADVTRARSASKVAREQSKEPKFERGRTRSSGGGASLENARNFLSSTGGRLLRKMRPGNGQVDDQADHDDNWGTESVAESEVLLLHPEVFGPLNPRRMR